ncbi:hypothetical protein COLO4_03094 [Corchorus olitorius]|uniref:Uncharacterized protein n=1 Tax=Corchorus olitorius TaxID=93759 RepID=A0A1R3KZK9_9ROSI|nr:hypothetical protein COLO4_03094 [Corchorus olitorius]
MAWIGDSIAVSFAKAVSPIVPLSFGSALE